MDAVRICWFVALGRSEVQELKEGVAAKLDAAPEDRLFSLYRVQFLQQTERRLEHACVEIMLQLLYVYIYTYCIHLHTDC